MVLGLKSVVTRWGRSEVRSGWNISDCMRMLASMASRSVEAQEQTVRGRLCREESKVGGQRMGIGALESMAMAERLRFIIVLSSSVSALARSGMTLLKWLSCRIYSMSDGLRSAAY